MALAGLSGFWGSEIKYKYSKISQHVARLMISITLYKRRRMKHDVPYALANKHPDNLP